MYFWKIAKLREDLIEGTLPQKEQAKYFTASSIVTALLISLPSGSYELTNTWFHLVGLLPAILTPLGILWVYHCNRGALGESFMVRALSVGFVVGIRVFIACIALLVAYIFWLAFLGSPEQAALVGDYSYWDAILQATLSALLWYRTGCHVRMVAEAS